ncbi:MAG TPA: bifunctional salicylyl-CoA 5-hydroxylase/oxidoreductase, partial [Planctomycetota bacterium]|nr:bifunctional salicylyl-CoA 5-hydroxylase/oxidoreductase [Planctomycetota bacterium]
DAWQRTREVDVLKTQKAAQTSLEWFENSARYMGQEPTRFAFNLMTRSKRITYENLKKRDPQLVAAATSSFQIEERAPLSSLGTPPPPAFAPFTVKSMRLVNRVVVSPMCQYMANDGVPNDWHLVHLGSRAIGGAGLIITEMTNVSSDGRITKGCAGLYNDEQEHAYRRVIQFVKEHSLAHIGVQLAHAGRKGSCHHPFDGRDVPLLKEEGAWQTLGPSPLPFDAGWPAPRSMDGADMERVTRDFVRSTQRALAAGFDLVELHMAHGYLLSSFLSPAANQRTDAFGGTLANRMRFPLQVLSAVRQAWPTDRPLAGRISATDWMKEGGFTEDESVELARAL